MPSKEFEELFLSIENDEDAALELLIHRCASDLKLYGQVFFPHYCKREFNQFHEDICSRFKFRERNFRKATAAPRGSAKSTWHTLILACHDISYGSEKFIVVISSTTPLANKKLKDIRQEISNNAPLRAAFGVRFTKKKVGESEFQAVSNYGRTYLAAIGRGSELRGIRINEDRPTKIISDDVEHSDEVYNEAVREKTQNWYMEDVTKAGDDAVDGEGGTNFDFVGTVLHRDSLLAKLLKNPAYEGRTYKAIISWSENEELWEKWRVLYRNIDNPNRLVDSMAFYEANKIAMLQGTEVMWEAKENYLAHMKDMEEIGRRAFMKEKQNDPQGAEDIVFEKFHYYSEEEHGFRMEETGQLFKKSEMEPIGAMDPSTGKVKATKGKIGDFTEIVTGYKHLMGRVFIHHDFTKRVSPTKYIQELFNLNDRFEYSRMAIETNLYRELLLPNIIDEKKRRQKASGKDIRMAFYEVEQTENKRERITRLEPKVNHGYMVFNRALSQEFMNQFRDFPHSDHDDAPDATEILWNLAHNRYKPAAISVDAQSI